MDPKTMPRLLDRAEFRSLDEAGELPAEYRLRKGFACEVRAEGDETDRRIRMTASTGAVDRHRDTIDPKGWELGDYAKNPVVLFAHNYWSVPIAKAVETRKSDEALEQVWEFAPKDVLPFAEMVLQLYRGRFMNASSVGFLPLKWVFDEERRGYDIIEAELLEVSAVPVPANQEALQNAKDAGLDLSPLREWAERALDEYVKAEGSLFVPRYLLEATYETATDGKALLVDGLAADGEKRGVSLLPLAADEEAKDVVETTVEIDVSAVDSEEVAAFFREHADELRKVVAAELAKDARKRTEIVSTVRSCARCGDDHADLAFRKLARPSGESTHWAPCPKTEEPILLRVLSDEAPVEEVAKDPEDEKAPTDAELVDAFLGSLEGTKSSVEDDAEIELGDSFGDSLRDELGKAVRKGMTRITGRLAD